MFKFIQKFFKNEEKVVMEELKLEELSPWLKDKVSELKFGNYVLEYLKQVREIKSKLEEGVKNLEEQEISEKEKKQVEGRIINIVKGHKDHYVLEIENFIRSFEILEREKFSTIENYQEAINFNKNLDEVLERLAKKTDKSYQASQHLFFDHVEALFKILKELNTTVKRFENKVKENKIIVLSDIFRLIIELNSELEKKQNLVTETNVKEEELASAVSDKEKEEQKLEKLKESEDYKESEQLKHAQEELNQKIKNEEHKVFSFFSKISKALKKYERIALDNKLIKGYLEDSVESFKNDDELLIGSVLSDLKKGIDNLNFDDKQKNSIIGLIENANEGYLQELKSSCKKLYEEKIKLRKRMDQKVVLEIDDKKQNIIKIDSRIKRVKSELSSKNSILEKISIDDKKEKIVEKIKEVFNKKIKLISS